MLIAMTGVSGSMGSEALAQVMEQEGVRTRVLLTPRKGNDKLEKELVKQYGARIEILRGQVYDKKACEKLVSGADMLVNMAAVIPPRSDKDPKASYLCNYKGAVCLADAAANAAAQPKFIHISTVAVYGNRTLEHPWGRPGDPLLPAVYDHYALHKMMAERYVMERGLKNFAVLRQSAMLYEGIIFKNIHDGLLFHTTLNGPLEWVSARDSGYLIRRIAERELAGGNETFWNGVYDIAGGAQNRCTGYDTFADGFSLMGGSPKKYFKPCHCETRNFHGLWFADGALEEMFGYQRDTVKGFWEEIGKKYKFFKAAKLVPSALIRLFLFRRLLGDGNAPAKWIKKGDEGRVIAAFGGMEEALSLPHDWEDFAVADAAQWGGREARPLENCKDKLLSHGYDESKRPSGWTIEDMRAAAAFRGGACLSEKMGATPYDKLQWCCSEGHVFSASPYTVLKGGHWCPACLSEGWNFDSLAPKSPFYAQVWYDSHTRGENMRYWFDEEGNARFEEVAKERA